MTNMVPRLNNNTSTHTSHVGIYYKTKSFYLVTCLSTPMKGSITCCANYYFDETNFPFVRGWKPILGEQCEISWKFFYIDINVLKDN